MHHQSGWSECTRALKDKMQGNGILFMTNGVEKLILESFCNICYEDWIGFIHMTSNCVKSDYIQDKLKNNPFWKESVKKCKCLLTLSDDLRKELQSHVSVPVKSVFHPTNLFVRSFESIGEKVLFIGSWLRDISFFERIAIPPNYKKVALGSNGVFSSSIESCFVSSEEYDCLLSQNIVLLKLHSSSANNVVIECIARGTPIVINRLPALEEYLGKDYPLFYNKEKEVYEILDNADLLMCGSDYLKRLDKEKFSFDYFARDVNQKLQNINFKLYV